MATEVVRSRMYKLSQILQQKRRVEFRHHHVGGFFLRRETLQGRRTAKLDILIHIRWTLTLNSWCFKLFWVENERSRSDTLYRWWRPFRVSTSMSRENVLTDERMLDLFVRGCYFLHLVFIMWMHFLIFMFSLYFLLCPFRQDERPDFKKVAESMKSYHYSISGKAKPEGADKPTKQTEKNK